MPTIGVARAASPFSKGFDALSPIPANVARMAKADGFEWVGQYIHTLTPAIRDGIFAAGLGIAPLTVAITEQVLTSALGTEIGTVQAGLLKAYGCPGGVHLWADHELPAAGSDSFGYLQARAEASVRAGFAPGQYVGAPNDLTGPRLFQLSANRYWKGGGGVPVPDCEWCVIQLEPLDQTLWGIRVDVDIIKQDFVGRTPVLWWPS